MKRYGNLYEEIISIENLEKADIEARKNKAVTKEMIKLDKDKINKLEKLHDMLVTQTFHTSPYRSFWIFETKARLIQVLPYYPDKIVHHAIMRILSPIIIKTLTYNTYACIKGRGIEGCARRVEIIIKKYEGKTLYCLKIDIVKFFPSIDHNVMKAIIRRKIKDKRLLWLLDDIIDSCDGISIGNHPSHTLANLYFAFFMHWLNEEVFREYNELLYATEYADDFVIFAERKETLWEIFRKMNEYIDKRLNLKVKGNYQIFPVAENRYDKNGRALDYVGYCFYREQKLLRKRIKKNFCRKTSTLSKIKDSKIYKQNVSAWLGWAKHSDSKHLLKTIIKKEHYGSIL